MQFCAWLKNKGNSEDVYKEAIQKLYDSHTQDYIMKLRKDICMKNYNSVLKACIVLLRQVYLFDKPPLIKDIIKITNERVQKFKESVIKSTWKETGHSLETFSRVKILVDAYYQKLKNSIRTFENNLTSFVYNGRQFPRIYYHDMFNNNRDENYNIVNFLSDFILVYPLKNITKDDIPILLPVPIYYCENCIILALSPNLNRGIAIGVSALRKDDVRVTVAEIFKTSANSNKYYFADNWIEELVTITLKLAEKPNGALIYPRSLEHAPYYHNTDKNLDRFENMQSWLGLEKDLADNYLCGIKQCRYTVIDASIFE